MLTSTAAFLDVCAHGTGHYDPALQLLEGQFMQISTAACGGMYVLKFYLWPVFLLMEVCKIVCGHILISSLLSVSQTLIKCTNISLGKWSPETCSMSLAQMGNHGTVSDCML